MRFKMRLAVIVFLLVIADQYSAAAEKYLCFAGDLTPVPKVDGIQIKVSPYHPEDFPADIRECRLTIRNAATGAKILRADDHVVSIVLTGQDLNGDGVPDVVLEGYSGGNHGTSTYYVISTGDKPSLILKFETDAVPAKFVRNLDSGKMEIHTWDGAFFMLDGMAAAFSPYPDIYLQVDGTQLRDISAQHKADYDKAIRGTRKSLPAADFDRFQVIDENWSNVGEEQAASSVVKIAVAYLYSGRELEAHAIIRQMWPAFDQERIWKLILKTRRRGILRYTRLSGSPRNAM